MPTTVFQSQSCILFRDASKSAYSISATLGQRVDFQHGIVRWHLFERYITMPSRTCKTADVAQLMGQAAALLLLFAGNDRDLITQLAALLGQGMDVQVGGLRAS